MLTKLFRRFYRYASPEVAYRFLQRLGPWAGFFCLCFLAYGLFAGLYLAPTDYQQGEVYRLIYIHVPCAIGSLGVYSLMSVCALVFLIWKVKIFDMVAEVSATLGALTTLLALVTGSVWGKPTWGTWWIWDARLTSELILLFIYVGIIGLRRAIPERQLASQSTAVMTLIGSVNLPIVHYSVQWWHTLHQGPTLLRLSHPTIAASMLAPLLAIIFAFWCYYFWYLSLRVRECLLVRCEKARWVSDVIRNH